MDSSFILKGDLCYSVSREEIRTIHQGYLACQDGICVGVYHELPPKYQSFPLIDCGDSLVLPGLVDLHIHAPQYAFWGLGMDLELIEWLSQHAYPEEAKYHDMEYARKAYSAFVERLRQGPNTRAVVFATRHVPATVLLMDMLEESGMATYVGKVNMDRNCDSILQEKDAASSLADTQEWLRLALQEKQYRHTMPILTPRFIPSCSDELLSGLGSIRRQYVLPLQSHMSENLSEVEWVKALCPSAANYCEAYHAYGLLGRIGGTNDETRNGEAGGEGMRRSGGEPGAQARNAGAPSVMAHCVWMNDDEISLMREHRVFAAHCPQSNMNLASGISPVRKLLNQGVQVGLGSDVAGGAHMSIFRAMSDAIQASKLYWRLIDPTCKPLYLEEAFYLGTMGGGAFFGQAGTFLPGYAFDALVIDDSQNNTVSPLGLLQRLARLVYQPEHCKLERKYVNGKDILAR
ncbi:MAG: amidohydrolase family protein [Clostridiales bacterium]|nr:amidohydrolase family protein [Clostridiales bacterium]